jgi:hypothetical protein
VRVAQPRFEIVEDVVADRNSIRFDFSAHERTHFKAQPELPGLISHSEIIVADEADIRKTPQVLTFAPTFSRTFNPSTTLQAINPLRQRFRVCRIAQPSLSFFQIEEKLAAAKSAQQRRQKHDRGKQHR